MALAFDSGIASTQNDLLDKLILFCIANGWTQNETYSSNMTTTGSLNVGLGPGVVYHIQKTDSYGEVNYMNFYACYRCFPFDAIGNDNNLKTDFQGNSRYQNEMSGIAFYGSKGYSSASAIRWDHQPGFPALLTNPAFSSGGARICYIEGQSLNYWFYSLGDSIHAVVEMWNGLYAHMSFGTLVKNGSLADPYTGGQYYSGCQNGYYSSYYTDPPDPYFARPWGTIRYGGMGAVYVNYNGATWKPIGDKFLDDASSHANQIIIGLASAGNTALAANEDGGYNMHGYVEQSTPSSLSYLTTQTPIYVFMVDQVTSLNVNIGYPEGIRYLNVKDIPSEAILTLSAEDWQCFPTFKNDPGDPHYATGVPGFSYLKE